MIMAVLFALMAFGILSAARGSRGGFSVQHAAWENEASVDLRERYNQGETGRTEFDQGKRKFLHQTPWAA